jgi:hypothetical protein
MTAFVCCVRPGNREEFEEYKDEDTVLERFG